MQRGHKITVLTGWPNYPSGCIFPAFIDDSDSFGTYHSAKVVRVPLIPRGKGGIRLILNYISFVLFASTYGVWRLRKQKFDVIFVFEPSPVTVGLPGALLRRLKKAPMIFWVLDLWPETLSAIGIVRSEILLSLVGRMVSFIYDNCDLVLGQSKGFVGQISKYCSNLGKIKYFPSWAESVFDNKDSGYAPEVEYDPNSFNILFAGNIGEAQDFPAILDAAEYLKEDKTIRWLIVGDGRKSDWLRDEVRKRNLKNSILLLGRFAVERMPSFYKHAQALLVTLQPDPFMSLTIPGKLQSYFSFGLPVLGMLDGEGATIIREADAGLVCEAGNGQALSAIVKQLSQMPAKRRSEMGWNGKQYALNEFDRKTLIKRLEKWMYSVG